MKRVNFRVFKTFALIIAIALGAVACSKDTVAEIPGATTIECKGGDNPTLSFNAGDSWQLSSNAKWCTFVTSAGNMQEMAGNAGLHTVTLNISDEGNGNSWSTATITMKMNGQSAVIATVKRHPKELYMKLSDIAENPLNPQVFSIGYVDYAPTYIEANFRYAATEIPEWIEVKQRFTDDDGNIIDEVMGSITGIPGERSWVMMRIVNDGYRERYPITADSGHVIKFSDEQGTVEYEFPIVFAGMGSDDLTFIGPSEKNYGWEVSLSGKEFRQYNEDSKSFTKFGDSLQFDITSLNDEFDILYIEKKVDRGISSYNIIGTTAYDKTDESKSWMHFDKEAMTLTIDEGTSTRYGLVMALPRGAYNRIRAKIEENIFDVDGASGIDLPIISDDYQKYVIIELTQHDFAEKGTYEGMYIYHSLTTLEIPASTYTDAAVMAEYGVEEAYTCPFVNSIAGKKPGIVIDPRTENWTTIMSEEGMATAEVYHMGEKLKISEDEYYLGENKDENLAIYLWGPKAGWQGENVYILFNVDGQTKKLLVVTPPAK